MLKALSLMALSKLDVGLFVVKQDLFLPMEDAGVGGALPTTIVDTGRDQAMKDFFCLSHSFC